MKPRLSFSQERLWFIEQYEGGTAAYNIPIVLALKPTTQLALLMEAVQATVSRHEILRTLIKTDSEGKAYQWVVDLAEKPLKFLELSFVSSEEVYSYIKKNIHHIFKLEEEFPIFVTVLRETDTGKNYFFLLIHHIAFDGWSTNVFLKDLLAHYRYFEAETRGISIPLMLPAMSIQYKDFSVWQRDYLTEERLAKQVAYWKNHLNGYEALSLPIDKVRPFKLSYVGEELFFSLEEKTSYHLRSLAKMLKVSLYSVLLSGYYLLLRSYSGQDDIILGTPVANRHFAQLEPLVGLFVNTLVIRSQINSQMRLTDYIEQVGKNVLEAQMHQDLPFEKLVNALGVEPDASRHPLCQVFFVMESFNIQQDELFEPYLDELNYSVAKFDLTVMMDDSQPKLKGLFNYSTSLFNAKTITSFIHTYQYILEQISNLSKNGSMKINALSYLNPIDYNQVVYNWNARSQDFLTHKTIHELFEEQVARTPNNIALVYEDAYLSYQELNQRANQLAHYLRATYAIKGDDLIALCLDRSELMLIAILAVLKSGAAYVPIDPNFPKERIQYILEDTQAKVLLTHEFYARIQKKLLVQSNENLPSIITHKNLAYIIYTSGTTGKPKGVMIEHRNLVNLAITQSVAFGLSQVENKHYLSCVNYIFDGQVSDIFVTITHGHTFYLASDTIRADIALLQGYIIHEHISWAHIPPVLLNEASLLPLETLIVAGDKTSEKTLKAYCQQGTSVINAYGPTESTVCATLHHYRLGDSSKNIGKSLPNITLYVLNSSLIPLPYGAIGELYIGGAGVARGYLNQVALTTNCFISNPFQTDEEKKHEKNARLYKTGDLVRYLSSGDLEFIGRNDFQVKIRGFRIELNEIENCLLQSDPAIQQVVVVTQKKEIANEPHKESQYLVGYYVSSQKLNEETLLNYLAEHLPDYMIPSALIGLDKLPLTANGKLDRQALIVPMFVNHELYVAPRNEVEAQMCAIFSKVLGLPLEQIGIQSDFFRLGGDSIISIQIISRFRQQLGIHLNVKDIFTCRNIERLYNKIQQSSVNDNKEEELSESGYLLGELPFLPIQHWFFDRVSRGKYVQQNYYNQSFLIKTPVLELEKLEKALSQLIAYHDAFRLHYRYDEQGNWHQYYKENTPAISVKYLNIQTLGAPEGNDMFNARLNDILTDWQQSFSLTEGNLYCFGYITGYADGSSRIYMALHHLIVDVVSWRLLMDDLLVVYNHADVGLGSKGTSYRQWIDVVNQYPQKHPEEAIYWESMLAGLSQHHNGFKVLLNENLRENEQNFILNTAMTKKLLTECHRAFHTEINDLLLTGLALALNDLIKMPTHYIALEGHGREMIEPLVNITRTLGWFTTIYPVGLSIYPEDLGESIQCVKEQLRSIPNKGIGFGATRGYNDDELPKITFNYLGQLDTVKLTNVDWCIVNESSGLSISTDNQDDDFIKINGFIIGGQLHFNIVSRLKISLLEKFVFAYENRLKELIEYTADIERSYLTVSDIDYVLTPKYLKKLQQAADINAVYLANSLQQGFIYHALNQGATDDAYRVQIIWKYLVAMENHHLKHAWEYAQAKYPSLRLRFAWEEEMIQIIDRKVELDWRFIDLKHQSVSEREATKTTLIASDRQEIYYLDKGKLLRIYLIQETETETTCMLSCHHAIMDGWSYPPLLNYVHTIYLSLLSSTEKKSQNIIQEQCYGDAQKYLQTMNSSESEQFWRKQLARLGTPVDLHGWIKEEYRTTQLSHYKHIFDAQEQHLVINNISYQSLKKFSQDAGITINAICQYVWHKLLHICGNTSTTIVGTTVSGRALPINDIEESVGLYINTLPLIVEHESELTILEALKEIQNGVNQLNAHSYISLATLQTEGERLFNNLFIFENYPMPVSENKASEQRIPFNFVKSIEKLDYPLALMVYEKEESLFVTLKYAGELFHSVTIDNILQRFYWILTQIIKIPDQKQNVLNYLMPEEKQEIIYDWNAASQDCSGYQTIQELFEAQALKTPNNIALVYEEISLSYQELNQRANQLAHYLRITYQIKGDDLIALCFDRSELMLIAILGVLKSGAAYVPIAPNYPEKRIKYMLQDTQAKVILSNKVHANKFLNLLTCLESIDSAEMQNKLSQYSDENPSSIISSKNLAYVIYTSGTTGKPKGVMIEHHSLINFSLTQRAALDLSIEINKHYLSCVSYVFDGQILDIIVSLMHGYTLHLASEAIRGNIMLLQQYVMKQKITWAHIPPAILNESCWLALETLIVLGDKTSEKILNGYIRLGTRVINTYGPTEATVYVSSHCHGINDVNANIGKPLPNVSLYVLNSDLIPLPPKAMGQLYIGGAALARGYLNQPELTDERFVSNPFQTEEEKSQEKNARLYKTGDLVRYLANGDLEFIGRNDFQVKIRGFRIELSEVENCLLQSDSSIQQTVVIGQKQQLVGYYVSSEQLDVDILYAYLEEHLPDYMVPNALVWLKHFPLTANGKIDREALPVPELTHIGHYIAPRNDQEKNICSIFAEVLGLPLEKLGIRDNFFRLGGNSILAIKLVMQLSIQLALKLTIAELFQYKTIEAILKKNCSKTDEAIIIPLLKQENTSLFRLSFNQEYLLYRIKNSAEIAYNLSFVLPLKTMTQPIILIQALQAVVSRHEVLRTLIKKEYYQSVVNLIDKPWDIFELTLTAKERQKYIQKEIFRVFKLDEDYPIFATILREIDTEKNYLFLVIHHIAFDGWSFDIFFNDLLMYYQYFEAKAEGRSSQLMLPNMSIQYKDFSSWQRNYFTEERLNSQLEYWKTVLKQYKPYLLPTDKLRPSQIDCTGDEIIFFLEEKSSEGLKALAKVLNVSLFSLLLSAYYLLLNHYAHQKSIIIRTPSANREHQQLNGLVGFFINTLILHSQVDSTMIITDYIQETWKNIMEAQLHQDLPFQRLMDELPELNAFPNPFFQFFFTVQSFNAENQVLFDAPEPINYSVVKYDLEVRVDDAQSQFKIFFNYSTRLFEKASIEYLVQAYKNILEQLANLNDLSFIKIQDLKYLPLEHCWASNRS